MLLRFFVRGVLLTVSAVLLKLETVFNLFLILGGIVVKIVTNRALHFDEGIL